MSKTEIRVRLRSFMEMHQLTSQGVADLLDVSVHTVNMWRSKGGTEMPENLFELLKIKVLNPELSITE